MLETLTKADFIDLKEQPLLVELADLRLPLTVKEWRDLPPISPRPAPFAIVLEGPADPALPQGTYGITHPKHGRLGLFIVPIGRDAKHTRYELIFN